MSKIENVYAALRSREIVKTQYDFSKYWLGKSRSYFSSMKAKKAKPSIDALTRLYVRLDQYIVDTESTPKTSFPEVVDVDLEYAENAKLAVWNIIADQCSLSQKMLNELAFDRI